MPMPLTIASDQMLAPTATAPSTWALTVPGQHRVDHVAADRGQLRQHQRQRQAHGGAYLRRQPRAVGTKEVFIDKADSGAAHST